MRRANKKVSVMISAVCLLGMSSFGYAGPTLDTLPIGKIDPSRVEHGTLPPVTVTGGELGIEEGVIGRTPEIVSKEKDLRFVLNRVMVEGSSVYKQDELGPLCSRYLGHEVRAEYGQSDLKPIYSFYLGEKVSLYDLREMADAITAKYRQDGYFLSRAILPPQQIKDGVVHVYVIEGFVDQVEISGKVPGGVQKQLERYGEKIKQDKPLKHATLERYVLLANDIPGLHVKTVLSPSQAVVGAAKLTFVVDRKPADLQANFNNYGTRYLGPEKIDGILRINSPLRMADELEIGGMHTFNEELGYVSGHYRDILGSQGLEWGLGAEYTRTEPGGAIAPLELKGDSFKASVDMKYPLIRSRERNFFLTLTFDWLDTETDTELVVPHDRVFEDHIRSIRFKGDYEWMALGGINALEMELSQGLPFGDQDDRFASRINGRLDYTKVNATFSHLRSIGGALSALFEVSGQEAFQPLLSAEEFGFGGRGFGRGYDSSEISGDSGLAGKLELRYLHTPGYALLKQVMFYTFCDAGVVWNDDGEQEQSEQAISAGIGTQIQVAKNFEIDVEYSKPLTRTVSTEEVSGYDSKEGRVFFNLLARI